MSRISWFVVSCGVRLSEVGFAEFRKPQVAGSIQVAGSRLQGNWSRTEDRACGDDVDRAFECSVASRLFSEVGVDVEERIDAFEQSRFDFVRRAVNDV
jgi:hypothetical protein